LIDGTCVIAAASRAMKDVEMQKAVAGEGTQKLMLLQWTV